jgi:hypothetical protein
MGLRIMAKQTTGEAFFTALFVDLFLWVFTFWTAFIVMVLEGAVADKFGLPTLGYWTTYLGLMLLTTVSSVFFRGVTVTMALLKAQDN